MTRKQRLRRLGAKLFLRAWVRVSTRLADKEGRRETRIDRPLRVAFVKQCVYRDLYFRPGPMTWETILSTEGRTGPVGLLEPEFSAEFHIVKVAEEAEAKIFQQKRERDMSPAAVAHRQDQIERMSKVAVDPDSIDWSQYDLVWTMECAVPSKTTRSHPETVWATMLEDHGMRSYREFLRLAPVGYDLFFSQAFGPTPRTWIQARHVVDWPYCVTRGNTIETRVTPNVSGMMIAYDKHQNIRQIEQIAQTRGWRTAPSGMVPVVEYVQALRSSRYYWAPNAWRPLWGNASAEAISAGCIFLGNPVDHWNPFCIGRHGVSTSVLECESASLQLEEDGDRRAMVRGDQAARTDWFCFRRPIQQLATAVQRINRKLRIHSALVT